MHDQHPGKLLAAELEKRGWGQVDLTFVLGCNPKAVNQIINGKQGVSPAMSKALGRALGLPEEYFIGIQRAYDLAVAGEPEAGITARATMLRTYPVREMVRRGWLKSAATEDLAAQLARFFDADSAEEIPVPRTCSSQDGLRGARCAPSPARVALPSPANCTVNYCRALFSAGARRRRDAHARLAFGAGRSAPCSSRLDGVWSAVCDCGSSSAVEDRWCVFLVGWPVASYRDVPPFRPHR